VIEQAKGMVAGRLGTDVDVAFTLLRDYARSRNDRLAAVSGDVVAGRLPVADLVAARRGRGRTPGVKSTPSSRG